MNFRVTIQEFCMVGGYTEDLTNHRTVKIGGWAIARGWALARDNTVCTYILHFTLVSVATGGYYFPYTDRKLYIDSVDSVPYTPEVVK